ncbi:acyl carrier protein [Aeromicrobium sp. Leaf350]|uniref:acyl carrier protein n=1 Tax=Aeromicrobium sp. Leaf350 TaxID=2876565 RepID=UPI001E341187|nr:acyl carrier protein [Aeromicrobium sp. Leaf350]
MVSEGEVRSTVVDLVVRLTGTEMTQIERTSRLKDLGIDSLLTVELADELGRRYDLYLSDAAVDSMRTVEDVVRSVVHHDGATAPAWAQAPDAAPSTPVGADEPAPDDGGPSPHDVPLDRKRLTAGAVTTIITMVVVGTIVGGALGLGASTLLRSAGLGTSELPPISASPTDEDDAEAEPSSTPSPSASAEPSESAAPEPSLTASSTTVAPGTRFTLAGAIPSLGPGAQLQVQVKDAGSDWDDFPVTLTTGADGGFSAEVYTSRTGAREWRLVHVESGAATPAVAVTIG